MGFLLPLLRRGRRTGEYRHLLALSVSGSRSRRRAPIGKGAGRFGLGRRRISLFSRNLYRHGLLGDCIGFGHAVARLYGVDPRDVLRARSLRGAARLFRHLSRAALRQAPDPLVGRAARSRFTVSEFRPRNMRRWRRPRRHGRSAAPARRAARLRLQPERQLFRLAGIRPLLCRTAAGPLPPYLRAGHFDTIRARADASRCSTARSPSICRPGPTDRSTVTCCSTRRTG